MPIFLGQRKGSFKSFTIKIRNSDGYYLPVMVFKSDGMIALFEFIQYNEKKGDNSYYDSIHYDWLLDPLS